MNHPTSLIPPLRHARTVAVLAVVVGSGAHCGLRDGPAGPVADL